MKKDKKKGKGGKVSGSVNESFEVRYEFNLFSQDDDGTLKVNQNGEFGDAVEDFEASFRASSLDFDNNKAPIPPEMEGEEARDAIYIGDAFLQDSESEDRSAIEFLDLTASFIDSDIDSEDRLEYSITGFELTEFGIDELILVIDDLSDISLSDDEESLDTNKATTDIEYIVENNLLAQVDIIDVRGREVINDGGTPNNFEDDTFKRFKRVTDSSSDVTFDFEEFPEAVNDSASTKENTAVSIDVLANDSDPDGDNLTIDDFDSSSNQGGTIALNGNQLEYTPAADFVGSDSFDYTISDGSETSTATVTVEVTQSENEIVEPPSRGDVISGGEGDDKLIGSLSDDLLNGNAGNDILKGGAGDDTLLGRSGKDRLKGNAGDDLLDGNGDDDILTGGQGNDTLYGRHGSDQLRGNIGDDFLDGNGDDDVLNGGQGNDTLYGGQGNDKLGGNIGDDFLDGNGDDDVLNGGQGNDTLYGGQGNDTLIGGKGSDVFYGKQGKDLFYLENVEGRDSINDFELGKDTIGLANITYEQLKITGQDNSIISYQGNQLAVVLEVSPEELTRENFREL